MANPQKETEYVKIPKEILKQVARIKLNGTQLRILQIIWLYTYGFERTECNLSETFIANAVGINRNQANREMKEMFNKKLLHIVKEATFRESRIIAFNENYIEWKQVSKLITGIELDTSTGINLDTSTGINLDTSENLENLKITAISEFENYRKSEQVSNSIPVTEFDTQERSLEDVVDVVDARACENKLQEKNQGEDVPTNPLDDVQSEDVLTNPSEHKQDEDVLTTPPATERLFREIGDYYSQLTGRMVNSSDAMEIQAVIELSQKIDVIKAGMDKAIRDYRPKHQNDRIRSFKYFHVVLEDYIATEEIIRNGSPRGSADNANRQKQDFQRKSPAPKKNRFVNFQGRNNDYSEIERMEQRYIDDLVESSKKGTGI